NSEIRQSGRGCLRVIQDDMPSDNASLAFMRIIDVINPIVRPTLLFNFGLAKSVLPQSEGILLPRSGHSWVTRGGCQSFQICFAGRIEVRQRIHINEHRTNNFAPFFASVDVASGAAAIMSAAPVIQNYWVRISVI